MYQSNYKEDQKKRNSSKHHKNFQHTYLGVKPNPKTSNSELLQRKESCTCDGGCPRCNDDFEIQTKLKFSKPTDIYEQEADKIANKFISIPIYSNNTNSRTHLKNKNEKTKKFSSQKRDTTKLIKSKESCCPFKTMTQGGQPLSKQIKSSLEVLFDYDFKNTRIHVGVEEAESAKILNSRAYTIGHDIVFGKGEYQPNTSRGRHLLIHELVHEMQQKPQSHDYSNIRYKHLRNSLLFSGIKPRILPKSDLGEIIQRQRADKQKHHFLPKSKIKILDPINEELGIKLNINDNWNTAPLTNKWHCSKHPKGYMDCAEDGAIEAKKKTKKIIKKNQSLSPLEVFKRGFNTFVKIPISRFPWYVLWKNKDNPKILGMPYLRI